MSTAVADIHELPTDSRVNYLNATYGIKSWLFTTDHKRIALLYLASITFMFFVGGTAAVLMRIHLIEPQGALVQPDTYNKLFSMHGIVMVFFFLVPSIPATLGNFLIPMMIGARDLAFPKLNLLSWYIYIIGAIFTLYAMVSGGVDTGWTFYAPYSSLYSADARGGNGAGSFHHRILIDSYGPELYRDDPQDAGSGNDVVPAAALHLGDVRDQRDFHSRHAGDRDHDFSAGPRTDSARGNLRSGGGRRSASCFSTCSGSTRIRRCTS